MKPLRHQSAELHHRLQQAAAASTTADSGRWFFRYHVAEPLRAVAKPKFSNQAFRPMAPSSSGSQGESATLEARPECWSMAGIGEAVGKLYVAKYFPPEYKAQPRPADPEYAGRVQVRHRQARLDRGRRTKKKSFGRAGGLTDHTPRSAIPDKPRDYTALKITPGDLVGDVAPAESLRVSPQRQQARPAGRPFRVGHDRLRRSMPTTTPSVNEIVFPAAILQPPFFNPAADDAVIVAVGQIMATKSAAVSTTRAVSMMATASC